MDQPHGGRAELWTRWSGRDGRPRRGTGSRGLAPGPDSDSPSHAEGQRHPEKRAEGAPGARLALRPPLTGRPTGSEIIPVISLLGFKASFKIAVYPTSWKTIALPHVEATSHTYLTST